MTMKSTISLNSKKIKIQNLKKLSELGKIRGLMFRRREKANALLFEFKKPTRIKLHSWFVFFPFFAIWLDNQGRIIKKRIVHPWEAFIGPEKPFSKLIEIPINGFYRREIAKLSGSQKDL